MIYQKSRNSRLTVLLNQRTYLAIPVFYFKTKNMKFFILIILAMATTMQSQNIVSQKIRIK